MMQRRHGVSFEGNDPDINRGFLEIFKQQIALKPSSEAIKGLAHLPGDEATDILLDVAAQGPSPVLRDAVLALAYRGDKRALPALEALRDRVGSHGEAEEDRALADALHVAIRALK